MTTSQAPTGNADPALDIERLLGRKPISQDPSPKSIAENLIRDLVGQPTTLQADPNRDCYIQCVDQTIATLLRGILHHQEFQRLEATWRGLGLLVNRVDSGVSLKIAIVNHSKTAWLKELGEVTAITDSVFYKVVVESQEPLGSHPWACVALLYPLEDKAEYSVCLSRCLALARAAKTTVLTEASDAFVRSLDTNTQWAWLREQPEAGVGTVLYPKMLLRRPYGAKSDPLERVPVEELDSTPAQENYLWGSPIWALVCLFADAFANNGWNLGAKIGTTLSHMPTHCYQDGGRMEQTQCTSPILAEGDVVALIKAGITPILSTRGKNEVTLNSLQSASLTGSPLRGQWLDG